MTLLSGSCERTENLGGIAKIIFPKWPEAIWAEWRFHVPQVIAGQSDMGPAKRGDVFDDIVWDGHTVFPQISDGGFQIFCVPQDDGGDQKVETGCFVDLVLITAIAHFAELVEEDPACESVSCFSSGQTCAGSFSQFQALHPFQGKQGPLQPPQFT